MLAAESMVAHCVASNSRYLNFVELLVVGRRKQEGKTLEVAERT